MVKHAHVPPTATRKRCGFSRLRFGGKEFETSYCASSLVSAADNSYLKGYTTGSCMSLEPPGHIGSSVHIGTGGFSVSIDTTEYSPGAVYNVTLSATKYPFTGFMVQGKGRGRTAGTFTDTPTAMSKKRIQALTCNTSKDSLTNFNVDGRPYPVKVSFGWKAPSRTVGDICFKSSVVETASLWFKPLEHCVSPVQQPSATATLPISPSGNFSVSPISSLSSSIQQPTTVASNQPTVRVRPPKLELSRGSVAVFHCALLGNPAPSLTLWKRAGTNSDLGAGNPLMIRNIQFSDQGVYICEADSGGSTLSASGMLVINEKPVVVNNPTGLTFVLGNYTKDIQLTCDAVGGNPVSRFWLKDGNTLVGETSHQLILPPVQSSDGGYACNFTNPYGYTLSQTAVITVQVTPNFTLQPQGVWTTAGNLVEFTCQATGNPQPSIQWYKDGSAFTDHTSNSLIIASVEKGHEGQYWCTATNVVSVVSSKKASLRVITKEPTFVEQPQSQTVNYGNAVTLTCPTLAHPPPNIQWLKDGIPLQGAMGDTLVISSFTDDDNGNYSCNATNTLGYNISSSAEVVVYREAPTFIQQPEAAKLFVGNPFNMTCIAKGVPDPTYSWYKTGKLIPGATSTLLVIKSTTFEDNTYYFCAATNIEGRAVSRPLYLLILPTTTSIVTSRVPTNGTVATAIVNVTTKVITKGPTFVEQPKSQTVNYGSSLTLTCPTLAHPPPNIQWLKDGIPLQGAMGDTLVISSFTDDDNGNYSCNATNTLGYNISAAAEVVVYRGVFSPSAPTTTSLTTTKVSSAQTAGHSTATLIGAVCGSLGVALVTFSLLLIFLHFRRNSSPSKKVGRGGKDHQQSEFNGGRGLVLNPAYTGFVRSNTEETEESNEQDIVYEEIETYGELQTTTGDNAGAFQLLL